jgi:hypothetical protein
MNTLESVKENLESLRDKNKLRNENVTTNPLDAIYDSKKLEGYEEEISDIIVIHGKSESLEMFSFNMNKHIDKKQTEYTGIRNKMPYSDEDINHSNDILEKRGFINGKILALTDCKTLVTNIDGKLAAGIVRKLGIDGITKK